MKKLFLLPVICLFFLTASCSSRKEIDLDALCDDLLQNAGITDELTPVDRAMGEKIYKIKNAEEQYIYISTGATAEEIAAFRFSSAADAEAALVRVRERLDFQLAGYESYVPEEVYRIKNAVIKQEDCYLVVCVADKTKAEEVLRKYF